jgi:uncharacterized protein with HEPN domain
MPRDSRLYLDDIVGAIERICTYTEGQDQAAFTHDLKTQDAVIRNLQVIGEAVMHLPESVESSTPEIDWRKVRALRNILVHEYFGVNLPIIWDVVQNKLAPLDAACRRLLAQADTAPDRQSP